MINFGEHILMGLNILDDKNKIMNTPNKIPVTTWFVGRKYLGIDNEGLIYEFINDKWVFQKELTQQSEMNKLEKNQRMTRENFVKIFDASLRLAEIKISLDTADKIVKIHALVSEHGEATSIEQILKAIQ